MPEFSSKVSRKKRTCWSLSRNFELLVFSRSVLENKYESKVGSTCKRVMGAWTKIWMYVVPRINPFASNGCINTSSSQSNDTAMIAPKNQELELGKEVKVLSSPFAKRSASNAFDTDASDSDSLADLGKFLTADAARLTLKWESSEKRLILGEDTYLPLDASRGCFSLELSNEGSRQRSPKEIHHCNYTIRNILFEMVSKISRLSPGISQLDLEGFGRNNNSILETTLDIEDIFEAFAKNKSSVWKKITVLRTWNCDMNSDYGNQNFALWNDEYPEALEEVYVHDPKGSVLSSSIFHVASRSKNLGRFYVFDSCDEANWRNHDEGNFNINPHRFNGSRLTPSSIEALCELLSSPNRLLEMSQLPFREILQLGESEFCRILEATTKTPNSLKLNLGTLRFPVVPPVMVSRLTILATRSETLRFYLLWKRSLEILRNPSKKLFVPFVLQKFQAKKDNKQYIPYGKTDLVYAMLQDSLQGILERQER